MSLKEKYEPKDYLDDYLVSINGNELTSKNPEYLRNGLEDKPLDSVIYQKNLRLDNEQKRAKYKSKPEAEKKREKEKEKELKDLEEKYTREEISLNLKYQVIGYFAAILYLCSPYLSDVNKVIVGGVGLFILLILRVIPTLLINKRWSKKYEMIRVISSFSSSSSAHEEGEEDITCKCHGII